MKKFTLTLLSSIVVLSAMAQGASDSLRYNQYGVPVTRTKLTAEERSGIIVFESVDQRYKLWFDVRVQVDGAAFFGVDRDYNPIGNNISIRRARFAIKSQITPSWYGELDSDFSNGVYELKDALIRYTGLCNWEFTLGNFKEDFSMEQTTSSRYLPFIERPMVVQTFAPSRHVGFEARWARKWLYLSGGVFFQTIDNLETLTYVEDNNKDYGRSQGMSYTGKAIFMPFYNSLNYGLHIGLGASYRTPKTDVTISEYGGARYSSRNSTSINRKKYLDTDVIPNVDHEFLYNVELAGYWKGLRVQSEYIADNVFISNKAPVAVNRQTKMFNGMYAMAGYMLFGGRQRYNTQDGEFTQPSLGRSWGDMELLFRYDYLNLNSRNIRGGAGENFTLGLNYYINKSVKFEVNYQYTNNDRYANGKGKLFVGHDSTGAPTKDPAKVIEKGGKAGVDYSMLGFRMEIDF